MLDVVEGQRVKVIGRAKAEGVEVRRGRLDLVADARIESGPSGGIAELPVSGWALALRSTYIPTRSMPFRATMACTA